MGQTLTHGIYLPDEGERNCYAGLAGNWQLLDSAVGTIAEHTTALAGKAPLVHTHTKSDVTDLFNSANTWSEHNTYTKYIYMKNSSVEIGNAPSNNTSKEISFTDKNNETLSRLVGKAEASGNSYIFLHATNKYTNGALDPNGSARHSYFYVGLDATGKAYNKHAADTFPDANNTYDLGSSSYQWNNLYAKNYYYNGVAWGLDKQNEWSANNSFYGITIYGGQTNTFQSNSSVGEKGDASIFALNIQVQDKNHAGWSYSGVANIGLGQDSSGSYISFALDNKDSNNTRRNNALSFLLKPTDNNNNAYFIPNRDNTVNLGTSTNRFKSLNGINPGALSLPDNSKQLVVDTTGWNTTGGTNVYTPPANGWLHIRVLGATELTVRWTDWRFGDRRVSATATDLGVTIPVVAGVTVDVVTVASGFVNKCVFFPCLGNV